MNSTLQENRTWSTTHRISAEDETAMAVLRAIAEPNKGRLEGTAARVPFDAIMERVAAPAAVTYEAGTVGGVPAGGAGRKILSPAKPSCTSMAVGSTGVQRRHSGIL